MLSHLSVDVHRIREKFAALIAPAFPQVRPSPPFLNRSGGKLRVGFLCTSGHENGFLRAYGGLMRRLNRHCFEVVGLVSEDILAHCVQVVGCNDIQWCSFSHQLEQAWQRILATECDFILHWQTDTDRMNWFLSFPPLAPFHAVGFGSHASSGIPNIDFHISSMFSESGVESQKYYTETLVQFPCNHSWQHRPQPARQRSRESFGLPSSGALFLCPQRVQKYHPAFDHLMRDILAGDPDCHIVLLTGREPIPQASFRTRMLKNVGSDLFRRIFFLSNLPEEDYLSLLNLADAIPDTQAYSSVLTCYDAFAYGIPVVTMPGPLMVQRYAAGLYKMMGMEGCITETPEEYVRLIHRFGRDTAFRKHIRGEILDRNAILYEDPQCVSEYEQFFRRTFQTY